VFIALVVKKLDEGPVVRSGVTASTRAGAISAAVALRERWMSDRRPDACIGPYRIFVGELTTEAVTPEVAYTEVKLGKLGRSHGGR
jgi:hypothetical protein